MISTPYRNGALDLHGMFFNPDKSVFMRITRKHNPITYNYTINDISIKEVSSTKYLGVTITYDLSWSTHNYY